MVNRFSYCNENGVEFPINLGNRMLFFEKDYADKFDSFFDGSKKGIFWYNGIEKIKLASNAKNVSGYPSVDLRYVIAVYQGEDAEHMPPRNAIIYNADGSVHKQLTVPLLISDAAKERGWWKKVPDCTIGFTGVNWRKDSHGNAVVVLEIAEMFQSTFRELRILDPKTGEFGECIYGAIEYK